LPTHKSAEKRARQNKKARLRNKTYRTRVKTLTKEVEKSIEQGSPEQTQELLKKAVQAMDKARSHGPLHRKTASRKISRLSRQVAKSQSGGSA